MPTEKPSTTRMQTNIVTVSEKAEPTEDNPNNKALSKIEFLRPHALEIQPLAIAPAAALNSTEETTQPSALTLKSKACLIKGKAPAITPKFCQK